MKIKDYMPEYIRQKKLKGVIPEDFTINSKDD